MYIPSLTMQRRGVWSVATEVSSGGVDIGGGVEVDIGLGFGHDFCSTPSIGFRSLQSANTVEEGTQLILSCNNQSILSSF